MVAKSQTFREIIDDIKGGKFSPIYLLMGEEPYYIDKIVEALEACVVDEEDRDFNLDVYYGADSNVEEVVSAAQQYPVMAPRRLVILKEAQTLERAKTNLEKMSGYAGSPNMECVFVVAFKGDNLNATSELVKAVRKTGVVFKSDRVRDYNIAEPIKDYVSTKRLSIDDRAVNMLAEFAGTDLAKLFGEIDKLIIAMPRGSQRISPELVESLIGVSKEFNNFELTQAVGSRDFVKAMKIVEYFSRNPRQNSVVVTVATLFNFFVKLTMASFSADRSEEALMKAMEVKSSYIFRKEYVRYINNYPGMKPMRAITLLRELDAKSKGVGSMQKEHDLLKETICKLFSL